MVKYISIHLPKTGGTSFAEYLKEKFGDGFYHYKRLELDPSIKESDLDDLGNIIPEDAELIHGHFKYKQIRTIHEQSEAKLILWVRDPVERVISHYFFIQKNIEIKKDHQRKDDIGKMSLIEFAEDPRFRNLYSQWIKGVDVSEFFFIGVLENFDHDLNRLSEKLGFPTEKTYEKNTNRAYKRKNPVSDEEINRIRELNAEDIALYNRALNRSGFKSDKEVICLASFPRTGNTFFRNLFYEVFGMESASYDYPGEDTSIFGAFPVIKTHLQPKDLEAVKGLYSKTLCIVRDGRDSVISNAHHRKDIIEPGSDFHQNLIEVIRAEGDSYFGGWSGNVESWIDEADCIVRYEDLVDHTEDVLKAVADRFGLENGQFDRIPTFQSLKEGNPKYGPRKKVKTEGERKTLKKKFFRRGKAGGWKEEMSKEELELFWKLHNSTMLKFGYTYKQGTIGISPYVNYPLTKKVVGAETKKVKQIEALWVFDGLENLSSEGRDFARRAFTQFKKVLSKESPHLNIHISYRGRTKPLSEFNWNVISATPKERVMADKIRDRILEFLSYSGRYTHVHVFNPYQRVRKTRTKTQRIFSVPEIFDEQPQFKKTDKVIYNSDAQRKKSEKKGFSERKMASVFPLLIDSSDIHSGSSPEILHPVMAKYGLDGSIPYYILTPTSEDEAVFESILEIEAAIRKEYTWDELRIALNTSHFLNDNLADRLKESGMLFQEIKPSSDYDDAVIHAAALGASNICSEPLSERSVVKATQVLTPSLHLIVVPRLINHIRELDLSVLYAYKTQSISEFIIRLMKDDEFRQKERVEHAELLHAFAPEQLAYRLIDFYLGK